MPALPASANRFNVNLRLRSLHDPAIQAANAEWSQQPERTGANSFRSGAFDDSATRFPLTQASVLRRGLPYSLSRLR